MHATISFIIPIYNVEKYIKKCFDSIYNQNIDINEFEIIAVNDGTPDKSMNIVQVYAEKFKNIHIINKKNGGVSSARNIGILNAKGKYILFIDPDDYISQGSIHNLLKGLKTIDEPDILVARSFSCTTNKEKYSWIRQFNEKQKYDSEYLFENNYERGSVCGVLFKLDFLLKKQILFPEHVQNGEDTIFFSLCMSYSNYLYFINISLYMIYEREYSASRCNYTSSRLRNNVKGLDFLETKLKNEKLNKVQYNILQFCKYRILSNMIFQSNTANISYSKFRKIVHPAVYLPVKLISSKRKSYKIRLLNFSLYIYYLFSKMKHYN